MLLNSWCGVYTHTQNFYIIIKMKKDTDGRQNTIKQSDADIHTHTVERTKKKSNKMLSKRTLYFNSIIQTHTHKWAHTSVDHLFL